MKKSGARFNMRLRILFLCAFLGVGIFFVLGECLLPPADFWDEEFCQTMDGQWFRMTEEGDKIPLKIPGKCQAERRERVVIETILPFDVAGKSLCFRSSRQDVEIYVDGRLRKKYSTEDTRLFGKTSAAAYVFLDFIPSDEGKRLKLVTQTDSSYSGVFQEIYYGTKMGIWKHYFKVYGGELMIAILMVILSVASIIVSHIIQCCYHKRVLLGDLGFGVLSSAIWIICNSSFRQIIFPEINVISDIPFFMIMLIPIPFLLYVDGIQHGRYHRGYQFLELLAVADTFLFSVLQIMNVADFADTITYISGVCLLSIAWIIATLLLDVFRRKIREYWLIAIGVAGTLLSGCAQVLLYFQRTKVFNGSYVAVGLVFLLVAAGISTVREVFRMGKERQEAIYASRTKAQFLASVSHEIRTPINAVLGLDEMILQEAEQEEIRDYAQDIQSAGRSLLALINDVLDFSKMESGKLEIAPGEYSVSSMLSDCYHMVFMRAGEKGLELIVRNRGDVPSKLYGDEVRIRQILINLLTNGVKYTKRGRVTLTVEGERKEEHDFLLILTVEDTGIGIKEEYMDQLFDSFQRLDERKNRDIEGTGLGLAITRQLVELMGGSISVESVYGRGSTFRVELPQKIVDGASIGEISSRYMENYRESGGKTQAFRAAWGKVLVVDDVTMNLKVFQGLLRKSGLEIRTADSGTACLEMASKESFHMIFLDHMMPGMDGVETLHALRSLPSDLNRDTPVIMLTANAIVGAKEEYLSQGFADYLSKPVRKSDLVEMIRKYLPEECYHEMAGRKEQVEEKPMVESGEDIFRKRFSFLEIDTGMEYCGNSIEIYRGTLQVFLENDQMEKIGQSFREQKWKDYQTQIHGLKSSSLAIGAMDVHDKAQMLEQAAKEGDRNYIEEQHGELIRLYKELLLRIRLALE